MTIITDQLISETTNEYNLFLLLKKNMIKGEIKLPNLSSKNRSLLHKICYCYGLEHYSTGNYKNRIIIIKDPAHTYFTNPNPFLFHNLKSDKSTNDDNENTIEYKFISQPKEEVVEEEEEVEEEIEEDVEEDVEEDEEEENNDTDTYDSEESECSENSNTYQVMQSIHISNQLQSLRMFSYINLIMNVIIICNL